MSSVPRFDPIPSKPPIVPGAAAGPVENFEDLLGPGDDLWADNAEFEAFLAEWRRWRDALEKMPE